ncbi:putative F420-0 ABC transporter substrate-binding protein [Cellulomonas sp. WB94]|uniref:putative F420-0 ABC transporter substrate-binding protein n=1 Tax=Cellulomonas sp. WB94 TaxID=2173174 RepID=UPI000D5817C6|nr:putative F420-0 ABC transporter substrate-binding protein [Cellulomonas sp. WB94]PVU81900.1 putative F420-0 ABC transporter substrate-binding protein [Cellulomonas sp. WB94]
MTPLPAAHRRTTTATAALLLLALAGCASGSVAGSPATTAGTPAASSPATATFSPTTLDNCGTKVTVSTPPERVVTIKSTSTEMLLALGLQDRIVGTAFADGPVPTQYAKAAAAIPVLSDKVPGQEALLTSTPDFVYAGWESNFSADGAGDRASLAALQIGTYVSPAACKEPGYQPSPLTFDDVFGEIREVAGIFGVPDRAETLISEQQDQLAAIEKPVKATTALWYSSGSDTPYVGAGIGAPQMIMDAAGITNIFEGVRDTWTPVGWEQVVAADPDVIVLVDATWNTAAKKIDLLEQNPATSQLTAVRDHRYLTVPFASTEAGVRNVDAAVSLAEQLAALNSAG